MKILFTTSSFGGGGITSYAHEVINHFSENNLVSVIVGNDSCSPITKRGVEIYNYNLANLSVANAKEVLYLINNKIEPDVIINSNAILITLLSPYFANNIRIVSVSHSLKYREADIASFNHKYVDSIISLSNYAKKYLINHFRISSNKISVVYNFVKKAPSAQQIRDRKKQNEIVKIVFAGGTSSSKTPEIVIRTIKELIKTNLSFMFYWMGPTTPTLKKLQPFHSIEELIPQDDRVKILGKIKREEAENIISEANIFFSPSRREGCPMALLEAMRIGTIAIVADYNIANKEMVCQSKNGFIIKHSDISLFVNTIRDVIRNHAMYSSFYDASAEAFNSNYSQDCWANSMDAIITNNNKMSESRKVRFNKLFFLAHRCQLKAKIQIDTINCLCSEYIPSAWALFLEYLKFHK